MTPGSSFAGSPPLEVLAHHFDCVQHQVRVAARDLTPAAGAALLADLRSDIDAALQVRTWREIVAAMAQHLLAARVAPPGESRLRWMVLLMLWPSPPGWADLRPELALQVQAFLADVQRVLAAARPPL